ncbi:MAG: aldo/keto reductase family oxidoreductase [Steroidobacteraceae bacterium]
MKLGPTPATRIPLGSSGLEVAPLGWGMWRLPAAADASPRARVEVALEIGCTLFDTADVYGYHQGSGFGEAERILGAVLREAPALRERMVLATKAGIAPPTPYNASAPYLVEACEASLARLGVERIDLLQVHRPDLLAHPQEVAQAFEQLRRAGKIRAAGVSNYSAAQFEALRRYLPFELATVQNEFSPLAIEPLTDATLDTAMSAGTAVLAWSPLAQGRLAARGHEATGDARTDAVIAALQVVAERSGATPAAVAYAWIRAHPARPIPLIGSQSLARIRAARAAYAVHMTRQEWYRILVAARGARMP